jgi:hypothetical protein
MVQKINKVLVLLFRPITVLNCFNLVLFVCLCRRERTNKRKVHEVVNEYTLLWRGMIGSEYAAQTTNISA